MHTPQDFAALERAFFQRHAQFARVKSALAGLDPDLTLEVPVESLVDFTEVTEVTALPGPAPASGVRA